MKFSAKSTASGTFKKEMARLREAFSGVSILVGVPRDALPYPDGTSTVMVAAVHEFGSATRNIPERSFMRSTLQEQQKKYIGMAQRGIDKVVKGQLNIRQVAGLIGTEAENDMKDKITDLKTPPLKPRTIKKKKSDNPLIDTGHLRQSIRYEVRDKEK